MFLCGSVVVKLMCGHRYCYYIYNYIHVLDVDWVLVSNQGKREVGRVRVCVWRGGTCFGLSSMGPYQVWTGALANV